MTIKAWICKLINYQPVQDEHRNHKVEMRGKFAEIRKMSGEFADIQKMRAKYAACKIDPFAPPRQEATATDKETTEIRFSRRATPESDTHQLAAIMEALARESRMYMAEYTEVMRMEREFDDRLAKRTTSIIRISVYALVMLGAAILLLISSLTANLNAITEHTNEMSKNMVSMRSDMTEMTKHMDGVGHNLTLVTRNLDNMNQQIWVMNGQMNHMTKDVNTMSLPMRMIPFRP
jgi:hypothetical protein